MHGASSLPPACLFAISSSVRPPSFQISDIRIEVSAVGFEETARDLNRDVIQCMGVLITNVSRHLVYPWDDSLFTARNMDHTRTMILWFVVKFFLEVYSLYIYVWSEKRRRCAQISRTWPSLVFLLLVAPPADAVYSGVYACVQELRVYAPSRKMQEMANEEHSTCITRSGLPSA